ncbi:alpha/beta fold hydrolase [Mycolicibacterium stellerae]|uniref:alpha/beta fold hydrolase n=1 Tax=Mycolicibacterium stellerae TaxID=2358193 RepID=UPI000F0BBA80|nr:alpha/beta hydrolase [Mycolicibacterium stellerae]
MSSAEGAGVLQGAVHKVALNDVELAYRVAGSAPEMIVLLHGWPQTGLCWRKIVSPLSQRYTVIVPDLRGYGASGVTRTGYDKRATAGDLGELVDYLDRSAVVVVGHDRGARVAHRWALDRPSQVRSLALLDVLPTRVVMNSFNRTSAASMWHWFFHLQSELPELLVAANVEAYLRYFMRRVLESGDIDEATFRHYVAAFSDPDHLHASFEDYRAGFTTDLELDEADHAGGVRLQCPLLLLWGASGALATADVLAVWREHHASPAAVSGRPVPGGHYVPEESPAALLEALDVFLTRHPAE